MLKFYLNGNQINVETNSCFISTLDKSFDTGTLALEWNGVKNSIFPKTQFKIVDTELNDEWNFIVIQDVVTQANKTNPIKYIHSLTVEQDSFEMTDHIVRNSVFQQVESGSSDFFTFAVGYVNIQYFATAPHFRIMDSRVNLPIKSYTPDVTTYKKQRRYLDTNEKVENVVIDIESTATAYTEMSKTTQINMTHPNTIVRNVHGRTYLTVNFYQNENDVVPTDWYDFSVAKGQTRIVIPKDFFEENGAGWYEVALQDGNSFVIDSDKFNSSDLAFVLNGSQVTDENTDFPTILFSMTLNTHFNTYYYSLWDVLDILCKQVKKVVNNEQRISTPYKMPSKDSEHGKILAETVAPEFTFTGKDLYSCVSEVMSYIDSIPMLNENGEIDFEELNNNQNDLDSETTFADVSESITNENFVNRIVTPYQNGKQETPISSPAKNVFRKSGYADYGVTDDDKKYAMLLPTPIDKIKHVYLKLQPNDLLHPQLLTMELSVRIDYPNESTYDKLNFGSWAYYGDKIDIAKAFVESALYEQLYNKEPDELELNKYNAIPYTRGSTEISFGGKRKFPNGVEYWAYKKAAQWCILNLMYEEGSSAVSIGYQDISDNIGQYYDNGVFKTGDVGTIEYNIVYFGVFDGQCAIESREPKYNGEQFVAQTNGNVQLNRMGANMAGLIARLGNEKKNVVLPCTNYGSRIRKGSRWEDSDGNIWRVNVVKTTFSTSSQNVIVECEFTKNFNMNSEFTSIDQEYRLFEISEQLTVKGYENVNEIVYFSLVSNHNEWAESIAIESTILNDSIKKTILGGSELTEISFATLTTEGVDRNGQTITLTTDFPLHTYGLGNTICFEMNMNSPVENTKQIVEEEWINILGIVVLTQSVSKPVLYSNGISKNIDVKFYREPTTMKSNTNFPIIENAFISQFTEMGEIDMEYYKKPNEIVHLNYGISFLPYPIRYYDDFGIIRAKTEQIFFGDKFIRQNALIQHNENQVAAYKPLKLYTSQNKLYSVMDKKALGFPKDTTNIYFDGANRHIQITTSGTITCKSWCLADDEGNIYIAVNQEKNSALSCDLFYCPRKTRL